MDSEVGGCSDCRSCSSASEEPEEELRRGILVVTGSAGGTSKVDEAGWGPILIMASGDCGTTRKPSAASAGAAEGVMFDVPVIGAAGVTAALKGGRCQSVVTHVTLISHFLSLFLGDSHLTMGSSERSFFFGTAFLTPRFGISGIRNRSSSSASHFLR